MRQESPQAAAFCERGSSPCAWLSWLASTPRVSGYDRCPASGSCHGVSGPWYDVTVRCHGTMSRFWILDVMDIASPYHALSR